MRTEQPRFTRKELSVYIGIIVAYLLLCVYPTNAYSPGSTSSLDFTTLVLVLPHLLLWCLFLVQHLCCRFKLRQLNSQNAADSNRMYNDLLEKREKEFMERKRHLERIRSVSKLLTLVLLIFSFAYPWICFAARNPLALDLGFFPCMYYVWCSAIRIPVSTPTEESLPCDLFLSHVDYPKIYEIADRAAAQNGCRKPTRIVGVPGLDISIVCYDDCQMLNLGIATLQLMNEEELYAVLLHEFAHARLNKEQKYSDLDRFAARLSKYLCNRWDNFPFAYLDTVFAWEYQLYSLAGSVLIEKSADLAMGQSSPEAAASALLKLAYLDYYEYEASFRDYVSIYEAEEPTYHFDSRRLKLFREQLEQRRPFWDALIQKEIQSRKTTHPITRDRFRALGVESPVMQDCTEDSRKYTEEKRNLLVSTETLLHNDLAYYYAEKREQNYLIPLKIVRKWEAAGEPLRAEEYRKIGIALFDLGQVSRADALFRRAIAELPAHASAYAMLRHGTLLLHRYDAAGVDLLWQVLNRREYYGNSALEAISKYALLAGNQELLDTYRERVVEEQQKFKDYGKALNSLLPRDKLEAESLPENQLKTDLAAMRKIGGKSIETIYLVRKTVGEHFRSQYVIKLTVGISQKEINGIMDDIFNYLDTVSDWPYGLFCYEAVQDVKFEKIPGSCVYQKEIKE